MQQGTRRFLLLLQKHVVALPENCLSDIEQQLFCSFWLLTSLLLLHSAFFKELNNT
jgi:hypothetical protein